MGTPVRSGGGAVQRSRSGGFSRASSPGWSAEFGSAAAPANGSERYGSRVETPLHFRKAVSFAAYSRQGFIEMGSDLCRCRRVAGPGVELHSRCFGQIWLFDGVPVDAWEGFAKDLIRRQLAAGEALFREGDPADSMWLIKSGSVKLWKATDDGRVLTLDIRKAGDLLGENVLTEDGGTYPVSATCLGPTTTCGIDRRTFESLVTRYPQVGLVVIRNLSRRIDHLSGKLGALSELSLEDRLYEVLFHVARDVGTPAPGGWNIAFPLTHEEIGFLVGAHRVSVTRALGKLRDTGRVRTAGKFLFVRSSAGAP